MNPWSTIALTPDADPWATPYGFALDHIWACPETNAARRAHWPEGTWVVVMPCVDLHPPTELSAGATHWVFFAFLATCAVNYQGDQL